MATYYIGLGSNIQPREFYLQGALKSIEDHPALTISARSSIYETAPVGYEEQGNFLNMVIQVKTLLNPKHLYSFLQGLEGEFSRERKIKWGPRTLDLDILLYSEGTVQTNRLIIPHPRMHERAFVLIPLAEINPDERIAAYGKTVAEMTEELPEKDKQEVVKWKPQPEK